MPGLTLEDLQRKYPPANREEYDRARAAAELAGALAELFYAIRSEAGLTQAELAARMSTTQSSIARMESGASLPTIEMMARLAQATGMPMRIEAPGIADVEILAGRTRSRATTRKRPRSTTGARLAAEIREHGRVDAGQGRKRA